MSFGLIQLMEAIAIDFIKPVKPNESCLSKCWSSVYLKYLQSGHEEKKIPTVWLIILSMTDTGVSVAHT